MRKEFTTMVNGSVLWQWNKNKLEKKIFLDPLMIWKSNQVKKMKGDEKSASH